MLEIKFLNDKAELLPLAKVLGIDLDIQGASFVLFESGTPCGMCRVKVGDSAEIIEFKLLPENDNFETRDFFFRALLFKFSLNPIRLYISKKDERLVKFGFIECGEGMEIYSSDVVFPHTCGG